MSQDSPPPLAGMAIPKPSKVLIIAPIGDMLIRFRWHLIKALVDSGSTVLTVAAQDDGINGFLKLDAVVELQKIGVHHHPVPLQRTGSNPLQDLRTLWSLFSLFRKERPDILVTMTAKPIVWGTLAGWLAGVPRRVVMVTGLAYGMGAPGKQAGITYHIAHRLFRLALRRCHHLIFQNPDDRRVVENSGMIHASTTTGIVNGSGVDMAYFHPVPLPTGPPVFLMIARLIKSKGVEEFLEASRIVMSLHPKAKFLLVGPLERHPEAIPETIIQDWMNAGVGEWLGPMADIRLPMAKAAVFVLPSYHEGTPRTVLEAMAMGRPIITTDAPGCRETTVDQDNGLLVQPGNVPALAEAMLTMLRSPHLVEQMGRRSLERVAGKYEIAAVTRETQSQILGTPLVQS